jgi:hypothetical protein
MTPGVAVIGAHPIIWEASSEETCPVQITSDHFFVF